ncbi:MAG TPA: DUF2059 domain-containing protein [Steroidobacteraceae bacterium]|jgi:hypothetical protein|nr:DUF2059 domain-containing protein [Steroidobacteraceae bacterium]
MGIRIVALLALLTLQPAFAQDAKPTQQSIRELLAVMQSHNMVDNMLAQMDATWGPMMKQSLAGRQPTEREQQIVDDAHAKIQALLREQLQWQNFEPMMIHVYQNSFSQKDVDAMKAFYSSPTGQQVIAKMPLVMQQTMQAMQQHMQSLIPQIQEIKQDMTQQLKAEREASGAAAAPPPAASSPKPQ